MYTEEYLSTYPFFRELLASTRLPALHDSLTGLISRPNMIQFIHHLIDHQVPFSLAILDLDNFKSINDNHGHRAGDSVLARVSEDLREFVGDTGIVGRFGGDEFLILNFKDTTYHDVHAFFEGMFRGNAVLRKNVELDNLSLYITGTIGCAIFPENATDYDTLFGMIDKTLYRGKSKGRNCYIIYVKEKHADLEIKKLARHSLFDTFQLMADSFDHTEGVRGKLRDTFAPMRDNLRLHSLYFITGTGRLVDSQDDSVLADAILVNGAIAGDFYMANRLPDLNDLSAALYDTLRPLGFQTALVARVGALDTTYGYLVICPEPHTMRIWQDDEQAAAFFLARMLNGYLDAHGKTLD